MISNMEFYEEEEGTNKYTIKPIEEVVEYQKRKDMEVKMLQFAKMRFWGEEDQEVNEAGDGEEGRNGTDGAGEEEEEEGQVGREGLGASPKEGGVDPESARSSKSGGN